MTVNDESNILAWDEQSEKATFRVVSDGQWRKGIRLENIYWACFEMLAKAGGLRSGQYIHNLISESDAPKNATSFLRLHVLRTFLEERKRLVRLSDGSVTYNALRYCGVPYFSISQDRRLQSYNPLFESFVRKIVAISTRDKGASEPDVMTDIRLSLAVPVDQLIRQLSDNPDASTECAFVISTKTSRHTARARVCLMASAHGSVIIAYVIS